MENTVNITLPEGKEGVHVVHLLEGKAPEPFNNHPMQVVINGDINAIVDYMLQRDDLLNKNTTIILFDEHKGTIELCGNPADRLAIKIKAALQVHPDLVNFGINGQKRFTQKDLESLVKMNRIYFADSDANTELLRQLKNFKAKVQSNYENSKDDRANANSTFNKNVEADIALNFVLQIPLFKGFETKKFVVDICFDVTDSSVSFWLDSVELAELQKAAVAQAFAPQKQQFVADGFTCINV